MRLIDADVLNFGGQTYNKSQIKAILDFVDKQPTAHDSELVINAINNVEKVVEQLEEEREYSYTNFTEYVNEKSPCLDDEYDDCFHRGLERAIKIVKQGITDDVCEWHKVKNGNAYKCNTHEEIHDQRVLDWCKCPYCGKKIKVVE